MTSRWRTTIALGVLLVAVTGCNDDATPGRDPAWPSTADPIATDGLVWGTGSEVHLPDGTVIELDQPVGSYVVAGSGVWYLSADQDSEVDFELATADGEVVETDANPYAPSLRTSADGRWLAFLDRPEGDDGPREAVVVDLTTGEEVVRSDEGLVPDDTGDVDWTDLYEELPVDVHGITGDTAYVRGLDDTIAYDLSTGEASVAEDTDGLRDLRPEPPHWNPAHTWSIPEQPFGAVPQLRPDRGQPVTTRFAADPSAPPALPGSPDLDSWTLTGWLDDTTAVGLTSTLDDSDPRPVLITCTVPDGECEVVPGNEGGVTLPVDRPWGIHPQA